MREKSLQDLYDEISIDTLHEAKDLIYMAEKKLWEDYSNGEPWESWWNRSEEKKAHDEIKKAIALVHKLGSVVF